MSAASSISMTNSPVFDWHIKNLRNCVDFSMANVAPVKLERVKPEPFGQGSGMLGIPGDFTPSHTASRSRQQRPASKLSSRLSISWTTSTFQKARRASTIRTSTAISRPTILFGIAASDLKAKRYYFPKQREKPDPNGRPHKIGYGFKRYPHNLDGRAPRSFFHRTHELQLDWTRNRQS
jgi:hypothetical protein